MEPKPKPSYSEVTSRPPQSPGSQAQPPQSRQVEFNANPRSGGHSSAGQAEAAKVDSVSEQARPLVAQEQAPIVISSDSSPDGSERATLAARRQSMRRAAGGGNGNREPTPKPSVKRNGAEGESSPLPRQASPPPRAPKAPRAAAKSKEAPQAGAEQEPQADAPASGAPAHVEQEAPPRDDAAAALNPPAGELLPPTALVFENLAELPQQRLTFRGHDARNGSNIVQTMYETLALRYLSSNWKYPTGLPKTPTKMRKLLLKIAGELAFDEDFLLQRPFTPNAMMATSRFQTAPNFIRVAKSMFKEGKITACFEGDLLMAAITALHFGVRVLILTGHLSEPPTNKVLVDFHPCEGVVPGRSILLTKQGDGFNWAYPASTVLADVSPDF
jgi:hypothetical protein